MEAEMSDELWWSFDAGLFGPSDKPRRLLVPLNAVQMELRAKLEGQPKFIRRSIDEQRVALGMVPLWGLNTDPPDGYWKSCRRRSLNRAAQQRCRARKMTTKESTDGR